MKRLQRCRFGLGVYHFLTPPPSHFFPQRLPVICRYKYTQVGQILLDR